MTPQQAQVWARYHKASERLADATDELIRAEQGMRAGRICSTSLFFKLAKVALAEYRAARAAMESL